MRYINKVTICLIVMFYSILNAQTIKASIQDSYDAEVSKNYKKAISVMKDVESTDINDPFYKLRLGWLYYLNGQFQEGLSYYQKANTIKETVESLQGIVNCHAYLGHWNDVITWADKAIAMKQINKDLLYSKALAYGWKMEYQDAASCYTQILSVYPYDAYARGYLVEVLYLDNQKTEAKKHYNLLKKYFPQNTYTLKYASLLD